MDKIASKIFKRWVAVGTRCDANIDNAIVAEGVDDVFQIVGLDKPNIGLLSPEFMEDVANLEQRI